MIIPIFIPHKGCPFDCIYCNQKLISGQLKDVTEEDIRKTVDTHMATMKDAGRVEIAFYGGSFSGLPREEQIRFLELANEYIKQGRVEKIRISTRPDYITREILDCLSFYNVKTIELGVQSLDEEVLKKSCRGHGTEAVILSSGLIREYGLTLGIQTMIGLPGDNREKDLVTARQVAELSPDFVRIYPTLVIRDTYLEKLYRAQQYHPMTLEEAVGICSELLSFYESRNIRVIRIGLQATDTIRESGEVIAGPFHPAFRELVESKIMLNAVEKIIAERNLFDKQGISILVDRRDLSKAIGNKKSNIRYLKNKYHYKEVTVKGVEGLQQSIEIV